MRFGPALRRRVERAQSYGNERRISIVRMLDYAIAMAHELRRRGFEPLTFWVRSKVVEQKRALKKYYFQGF